MTPFFFARLLMKANQEHQITEPSGIDMDYVEHDPSAMASQTLEFFKEYEAGKSAESPDFWGSFCELNSSDPACREYDN